MVMTMVKTLKLEQLASLSIGVVFKRYKVDASIKVHTYKLLTLKSFSAQGWIDESNLEVLYTKKPIHDKYLTKPGDVIIRLSKPFTAIAITKETSGIVVPSLFIRISDISNSLQPDYLMFLLNSQKYHDAFLKVHVGPTFPVLQLRTVKTINIPVVEEEKQALIAQLNNDWIEEKKLETALQEQYEAFRKVTGNQFVEVGDVYDSE